LELAQADRQHDNPLTARVIVNRVWLNHFGAGIVRTPSDFGLRSDPPSHPELLDYLAFRFMAEGWSLKKLHRLIMLSSVYQQGSDDNPRYLQLDPNNQLLWRMNRRRLDFETDARFTVERFRANRPNCGRSRGGNYDPALFRAPNYLWFCRTTEFAWIVPHVRLRQPGRHESTTLFDDCPAAGVVHDEQSICCGAGALLHAPCRRSREATGRGSNPASLPTCYQRPPAPDEIKLARQFLQGQSGLPEKAPEPPAWEYGYGEVDDADQHVKDFHPLPHFTGSAWQGGPKLPDENLGWVTLNAEGGHVGNDLQHAAIRRWRSPRDGIITITGMLKHESDKGDGVRTRVVSSRAGN
jgi:hypothetical protein